MGPSVDKGIMTRETNNDTAFEKALVLALEGQDTVIVPCPDCGELWEVDRMELGSYYGTAHERCIRETKGWHGPDDI